MTAPSAYYDKTHSKAEAKALLARLDATEAPNRSKPGVAKVFSIKGGGEAMVTSEPGEKYRVRLYAGTCPC